MGEARRNGGESEKDMTDEDAKKLEHTDEVLSKIKNLIYCLEWVCYYVHKGDFRGVHIFHEFISRTSLPEPS